MIGIMCWPRDMVVIHQKSSRWMLDQAEGITHFYNVNIDQQQSQNFVIHPIIITINPPTYEQTTNSLVIPHSDIG